MKNEYIAIGLLAALLVCVSAASIISTFVTLRRARRKDAASRVEQEESRRIVRSVNRDVLSNNNADKLSNILQTLDDNAKKYGFEVVFDYRDYFT